jgi:hypothetical protein
MQQAATNYWMNTVGTETTTTKASSVSTTFLRCRLRAVGFLPFAISLALQRAKDRPHSTNSTVKLIPVRHLLKVVVQYYVSSVRRADIPVASARAVPCIQSPAVESRDSRRGRNLALLE